MYRQHFPLEIKARSSHDIVAICVSHHVEYETVATNLKKSLFDEYQLPHNMSAMPDDMKRQKNIRSLCHALTEKRDNIPESRVAVIFEQLALLLGHIPSNDEIRELGSTKMVYNVKSPELQSAADIVKTMIDKNELQQFVSMWRQHFIDVMNPQHMPLFWDINRPITSIKQLEAA
jgi:hypothetical protein